MGVVASGPSDDEGVDPESTATVYAIYLSPEFWGQGIGRSLMAAAVGEMQAQGFRTATLWVLELNARTRRFYEAAGWCPDGAVRNAEFQGSPVREVRYRIALD